MTVTLDDALALHKQGKHDKAEDAYHELLSKDFDNPKVLYLFGTLMLQMKRPVGLIANLFMRALMGNENYFEAWNNLGNCYYMAHFEKEARACWMKALHINGRCGMDYADVYSNLASLHINDGTPEEGELFIAEALKHNPDHIDANWNHSLLLLEQGKFGEGFDQYKCGFKTKNRIHREYGGIPYWDGSPVDKIIVYGEQGIGDEILFSSMIPDLQKRCKKIIFDSHPKLETLFKASFPDITVYGTRKDQMISWAVDELPIDARISIGDLGKYFRRNLDDFPDRKSYLRASDKRVEYYKNKLNKISDRLKVGISWKGGTHKTRNDYRSIPLVKMKPVLEQDADFISLQYTPTAYLEVAELEELFNLKVYHWPYSVTEGVRFHYDETAALVQALDLVITVNTAVHHVAGALGKETWTFTPKAKAWRYWSPDGKSVPWYPSVKLIEQKDTKDWDTIIESVAIELKNKINERRHNEG